MVENWQCKPEKKIAQPWQCTSMPEVINLHLKIGDYNWIRNNSLLKSFGLLSLFSKEKNVDIKNKSFWFLIIVS